MSGNDQSWFSWIRKWPFRFPVWNWNYLRIVSDRDTKQFNFKLFGGQLQSRFIKKNTWRCVILYCISLLWVSKVKKILVTDVSDNVCWRKPVIMDSPHTIVTNIIEFVPNVTNINQLLIRTCFRWPKITSNYLRHNQVYKNCPSQVALFLYHTSNRFYPVLFLLRIISRRVTVMPINTTG